MINLDRPVACGRGDSGDLDPLSAVAALAEVCRREFGVLSRIANVERTRA